MHPDDEIAPKEPAERRADERADGTARDPERHPHTPATMQRDHEEAVGRQRYADARGGDYAGDFQADGSGSHPVKPPSDAALDERGIPDIAATEPRERDRPGEPDADEADRHEADESDESSRG